MVKIVCLIASILPGPVVREHLSPCSLLGTQFLLTEFLPSSVPIEPIKTEVGCMSIPESLKSKSKRFMAALQIDSSPHSGKTSIVFVWVIICGNSSILVDCLKCAPSNSPSLALPVIIISWGVNEKHPIELKSTSISI